MTTITNITNTIMNHLFNGCAYLTTLAFVFLGPNLSANAQYTLTVESSPATAIEGATTYRLYVNMEDPTDKFSAWFGNNFGTLEINAPEGVFNSAFNVGWNAQGINPAFLPVFPELADDTYGTIGLEGPAVSSGIPAAAEPAVVEDENQQITPFFQIDGATSLLSNTLTGAAVYVLNTAGNSLPDSDGRVLIMQITTTGSISGQVNYQIFPLGDGLNDVIFLVPFDGVGEFQGDELTIVEGCMQEGACNYNPDANLEPLDPENPNACNFPDECGVCDGTETGPGVPEGACDCDGNVLDACGDCGGGNSACGGCISPAACNYDPNATFNDGTCIFPAGTCVCDGFGGITNDADGDGICDDVDDCIDANCNGVCDADEVEPEYNISIEPIFNHDGSISGVPAGYTTYRIYINLTNELDFVSAVFGDSEFPLFLECTGDIYQTALGGDLATGIMPLFFDSFPEIEYDSWFTIGGANDSEFPAGLAPQTTFSSNSETLLNFNSGDGFLVADPIGGSWFNSYPCTGLSGTALEDCAEGNLSFAGADLKVLLGQITATGDVYGLFNCQVFVNGEQANTAFTGLSFSTTNEVFGCTDPEAQNYNDCLSPTIDDLSCIYPCALELVAGSETVTSPLCFGGNTGTIQIEAIGAQGADYFFLDTITSQFTNFGQFGGLLAGSYDIIVTDAAGCGDTLEVTVPDAEPIVIEAELTSPVSCNGESDAVITVTSTTGGAGDYLYAFSQNPTELTTDTVYSGLSAGTYFINVFDGNGCIAQSAPISPTNPLPLGVGLDYVVDASCANIEDGAIDVIAFGGGFVGQAPPATAFSVDGENFGPSPIAVSGGTYTVTVQNANGCTATLDSTVTVGPEAIQVNAVAGPESCFGAEDGEVSWTPVSGVGGYTYTVNGEAVSSQYAGMLAPGEYTVTVTDFNGCSESETVTVDAAIEIAVNTEVVDPLCFGDENGAVLIDASGGTGTFQYSGDGANYTTNNEFGGLGEGSYTFFVQDEYGCVESSTANVSQPDALTIGATVSDGSAPGEGSIDLVVTGGVPPYEYYWTGPGVNGQSTQDLEGLSAGIFTVSVSDVNGCNLDQTFEISAFGCTDPSACNYQPGATQDDGSCDYSCYGCTNPSAFNYNPNATIDDGSCVYFIADCASIGQSGWSTLESGVYPEGAVSIEAGIQTTVSFALHQAATVEEPASGQSFSVLAFDPAGISGLPSGLFLAGNLEQLGPNEQQCIELVGVPSGPGVYDVEVTGELTISLFGSPYSIGDYTFTQTLIVLPSSGGTPGCMYSFATNYNPAATVDDGSCYIAACTDVDACNYSPFATIDDGSCFYDCASTNNSCVSDLDGDGAVGSADLIEFLTAFGETCE